MAALDYIPYGTPWGDYDETDSYPEGSSLRRHLTCNRCGAGHLHWGQDGNARWRLYTEENALHSCMKKFDYAASAAVQAAKYREIDRKKPALQAHYRKLAEDKEAAQPTRKKETTMQYDIAAILRKDAFTVQVRFGGSDGLYTYVTNDKSIEVDDAVVVKLPNGALKIAKVMVVDDGCLFTKQLDTDHKWLVSKVDMTNYEENERINAELTKLVENARREHFRKQVAEKLVEDLPPETQALLQQQLGAVLK